MISAFLIAAVSSSLYASAEAPPASRPLPVLIREASAANDLPALDLLCARTAALRAVNDSKKDPKIAAELAEADKLIKQKKLCAGGAAVPARVPEDDGERGGAEFLRRAGARIADSIGDTSEPAALFDGARRRVAEPTKVADVVPATPKRRKSAAPEPAPVEPKPKKEFCKSNLEGYLAENDPVVRRDILGKASSILLIRARAEDADDKKSGCFSSRIDDFISKNPRRSEISCVRTTMDATGQLVLTYSDKSGKSKVEKFGLPDDACTGAPAPAPVPVEEKTKPVRPCKSNLEGYLTSADAGERRGILDKAGALIIKRAGVADEDDEKASCFSSKVQEFLGKRDVSCVRTGLDKSGVLTLTYTDKSGKDAVKTFGPIEKLNCKVTVAPPPAAKAPPEKKVVVTPPPIPEPKLVEPAPVCPTNMEGYMEARGSGAKEQAIVRNASAGLLEKHPVSYKGGGSRVDDLAFCLGRYLNMNPTPDASTCLLVSVDSSRFVNYGYTDRDGKRVAGRAGELDEWATRVCVPYVGGLAPGGRSAREVGDSSPAPGSGGGSGGGPSFGSSGPGGGSGPNDGGPRGGGGGGGGGSSPSPASPPAPAAVAAAPAAAAGAAPAAAGAASPAPAVARASAPEPAAERPVIQNSVAVVEPNKSYGPFPMTGMPAGGTGGIMYLGTHVWPDGTRDEVAGRPARKPAKKTAQKRPVKKPVLLAKAPKTITPRRVKAKTPLLALAPKPEEFRDALNAGPVHAASPVHAPSCGITPIWEDGPAGWSSGCFPPKPKYAPLNWGWAATMLFGVTHPALSQPAFVLGGERIGAEPDAYDGNAGVRPLLSSEPAPIPGGAYPTMVCEDTLTEAPPGWTSGCFPPDESPMPWSWLWALAGVLVLGAGASYTRGPKRRKPVPLTLPSTRHPVLKHLQTK